MLVLLESNELIGLIATPPFPNQDSSMTMTPIHGPIPMRSVSESRVGRMAELVRDKVVMVEAKFKYNGNYEYDVQWSMTWTESQRGQIIEIRCVEV